MKQLKQYLIGGDDLGHMVAHYLAFALLVAVVLRMMQWSREVLHLRSPQWNIYAWAMCTLLVVIASQELDHILLAMQPASEDPYDDPPRALQGAHRRLSDPLGRGQFPVHDLRHEGPPAHGAHHRAHALRHHAREALPLRHQGRQRGARVAAFISLGVLLLVVSFLYQKLKVLLKDDTDAPTNHSMKLSAFAHPPRPDHWGETARGWRATRSALPKFNQHGAALLCPDRCPFRKRTAPPLEHHHCTGSNAAATSRRLSCSRRSWLARKPR